VKIIKSPKKTIAIRDGNSNIIDYLINFNKNSVFKIEDPSIKLIVCEILKIGKSARPLFVNKKVLIIVYTLGNQLLVKLRYCKLLKMRIQ
jgi:hypothetical protein